jgi:hypothetical protein
LTSGPVAVRVVGAAVVGVVEGTVAGVVDGGGWLDAVGFGAGDAVVGREEVGEPIVADSDGRPPRKGRAAFV